MALSIGGPWRTGHSLGSAPGQGTAHRAIRGASRGNSSNCGSAAISYQGKCGSPLASTDSGRVTEVVLGTVDGDPGVRPGAHVFVGSTPGASRQNVFCPPKAQRASHPRQPFDKPNAAAQARAFRASPAVACWAYFISSKGLSKFMRILTPSMSTRPSLNSTHNSRISVRI